MELYRKLKRRLIARSFFEERKLKKLRKISYNILRKNENENNRK